ncbi:substrate-binding periplasmic protein [Pseudoduganella namucuonensis]|uniref:Extracellular solute-binding protein, family 3 n=1 Tax=Pseudoduganella namucuonensis TaxID=1035707 RepID=A0A1I7KVF9_9BURK|nr:transporter substrate-binding domain-containing protein [Pseudoduganella namucuonensis]SFV01492.1 extracellular solute-binding protein, family 3 [Pseudoduganella namucuonensis]
MVGLLLTMAPAWCALNVVYPRIDERPPDDYGYKVLELALAKSGVPHALSMSKVKMNQERARLLLERGEISVLDAGVSADFEARYDPVYFPLDRGLSGYRLLLIHKERAPDFARIRTLGQLAEMTAGQGPGWADIKILSAAGIGVKTAEFASLFRMVNAKRIDFYPLGADEILPLLERYRAQAPDVVVEPHLALHYPFARLFFVRKGDQELRDAIHAGLRKAFADGSLQKLLDLDIRLRDNLRERTIIQLDNPNLSNAFRQIPREYFHLP